MARIRTVKPSFWGSPEAAAISREARLLAIGLVSMADDDGRFLASPAAIAGYVLPNDEVPIAKLRRWLDEIADTGMIHTYTVGGVRYGCMPSWHKHQKINRYTASILPPPDIECAPRHGSVSDE